jgi:carbamoyltransferase
VVNRILGLSFNYHDSAACLIVDGQIAAAAEEERFVRVKHYSGFPQNAVRYCVQMAKGSRIDAVAFYEKPLRKLHRIIESQLSVSPRGLLKFARTMHRWLSDKVWVERAIHHGLRSVGCNYRPPLFFIGHHASHAASAFYPSPFDRAAVVVADGVGEWSTTTIGAGSSNQLELLRELQYPHSLGLLYSAFTLYCGFRVNSGEYKLMGLAPYGSPRYAQLIFDNLIDLKEDGSFSLNMQYFDYISGNRAIAERFELLFDGPARAPESPITSRHADLASSIQVVLEQAMLRIAAHARRITGCSKLCMAGGVALNCVANSRVRNAGIFKDIWVQPAAGDAGGAVGAALAVWYGILGHPRQGTKRDHMSGALLGPEYDERELVAYLQDRAYPYTHLADDIRPQAIAELLASGRIVALFDGRMEFGPRALGNRSILADARLHDMQSILNLKTKLREGFRPFAPACLSEYASDYFQCDWESPYMLYVVPVAESVRLWDSGPSASVMEAACKVRSKIPAVTHVDYSARLQSVSKDTNPRFYAILREFYRITGCPLVVNTSFNMRGEPIVCTPADAYKCFMRSAIDDLILGSFRLEKIAQPELQSELEEGDYLD